MRHYVTAALVLAAGASAAAQTSGPASAREPAAARQKPPDTTVDASRGGITIASGVNSLTIGARGQVRWMLEDREEFDGDTAGTGVGHDDGPLSSFDVPRLRLTLGGGVYRPWLRYSFQVDFSRTSGESASKIKDAVLEVRPEGRPYRLSFGQFKAPFGLQQLTSSGRLQFVDRAITDSKFNPGRDMGAMLSGSAAGRLVGYDAGIFNGSGESVRQQTRAHLWAGRVYVDPLGPYTLAEGGVDGSEDAVVHFGIGVRGGDPIRGRAADGVVEDADSQRAVNIELAYKQARLYSTAEYFWMTEERANPAAAPDVDSRGYHVQAGVMALPRALEVGVLWASIEGDTRVDDAAVQELRGVVGYYWNGHNLKVQADVGRVEWDRNFAALSARARQGLPALGSRLVRNESLADTQLRVQFQLAF